MVLPGVLVAAILVANDLSRDPTSTAVSETPAGPSAPVTVRLDVQTPTVAKGQPVGTTIYVVNHTGRALTVACSADGWHGVVVSGPGLPAGGFEPALPCPATDLAPGADRFAVKVPTGSLAAGTYRLGVTPGGLPPGSSLPPAVAVTIRLSR